MIKVIAISCLFVMAFSQPGDPNTFSNYQQVKLTHLNLEWYLNVDDKYVNATATYDFTSTINNLQEIWLDVYQLDIHFVYSPANGQVFGHSVDVIDNQTLIQGDRLSIKLPQVYGRGDTFQVSIKYSLDERAKALNFLTKEQTLGKNQPYVFSQCEDANCRSMIPLQDTPAVKHTYTAHVITRPEIKVFMSGNATESPAALKQSLNASQYVVSSFESKIPFQSYLIAIIAGNVSQAQLGARTFVITEPDALTECQNELSDLEEHLTTLEKYIGPYLWGEYKIVILPPSFPFGGMENPLLTFASPSIIVGDKSGVSVAIHEIAHSWTGNTVTCVDWSNFWLNEGFTVFLERKGLLNAKQYGAEYAKIDAYTGNSALIEAIDDFGVNSSYSSLFPNTTGVSPDDSFSEVPYEKGFQFLTYIESFIGPDVMQQMLQGYISTFRYQSIDQSTLKDYFSTFLFGKVDYSKIQRMNDEWDSWVKQPGYPPVKLDFLTQSITNAQNLAQAYIDLKGKSPDNYKDYLSYPTNLQYIFLQHLSDNKASLSTDIIATLDNDLKLTANTNKEILWRWFRAGLQAKYTVNLEAIHKFLGEIGRQKMILPVYTELYAVNPSVAQQYYKEYYNFYHPLARASVGRIVNPSVIA